MERASPGGAAPSSTFSDEREVDRLSSPIPGSLPTQDFLGKGPSPKRFSAVVEDISESALAAGFSYGANAPPRPGQFHAPKPMMNLPFATTAAQLDDHHERPRPNTPQTKSFCGDLEIPKPRTPRTKPRSSPSSVYGDLKLPRPRTPPTKDRSSPVSVCGDLEVPRPRTPRTKPRSSPSSVCGDLEVPRPRTPRTKHHRIRSSDRTTMNRPLQSPFPEGKASPNHSRTSSRGSNASRKRSPILKNRNGTSSERKRGAMSGVAHYLNQCVQIHQDEMFKANCEIVELRNEIRQQEENLHESLRLGSEKDARIQATEAEKQQLTAELGALNAQFKQKGVKLGERCRTYRLKLNEAIEEQQTLFNRSQISYKECLEELQKEKISWADHAASVGEALENSRKKTEELKQCFQEYRHEMELEGEKREKVRSQLEVQVKCQEAELLREQECVTDFKEQLFQTQEAIARIESQVQGLPVDELVAKLDLIVEKMDASSKNVSPPVDIDCIAKSLEDKILSRIMPSLSVVAAIQDENESSISQLQDAVARGFEDIRTGMNHHIDNYTSEKAHTRAFHQNLGTLLARLENESAATRHACERTGDRVASLRVAQRLERVQANTTIRDCILEQFRGREGKITQMENHLQRLGEDYANKVNEMKAQILQRQDACDDQLQETLATIKNILDRGFAEGKINAMKHLAHSEVQRTELEFQLAEVSAELRDAKNTLRNSDGKKLRRTLLEEQNKVTKLEQRLAECEKEAGVAEQLQKRWRRDIQAIDAFRGQLKGLSDRITRVGALEEQFQKVVDLNQVVNSTATYFLKEHNWVRQHLEDYRDTNDGVAYVEGSAGPQRKVMVNSPDSGSHEPSSQLSVQQEQQQRREAFTRRSILKPISKPSSRKPSTEEAPIIKPQANHTQYNRPMEGKASAPTNDDIFEPPNKPWSRKPSTEEARTAKAQTVKGPTIKPQANHTRYNRPMEGKASAPTEDEIVEQIRSSQGIGVSQKRSIWTVEDALADTSYRFPTLAEYKEDLKRAGSQGVGVGQKRSIWTVENTHAGFSKKVKIEDRSSQTQASVPGRKNTLASFSEKVENEYRSSQTQASVPGRNKGRSQQTASRRRPLRTYSRKHTV